MAFRKSRKSTRKIRKSTRKIRKSTRKSRNRRYLRGSGSTIGLCEHGKIKYSCPICKCKYMEC